MSCFICTDLISSLLDPKLVDPGGINFDARWCIDSTSPLMHVVVWKLTNNFENLIL